MANAPKPNAIPSQNKEGTIKLERVFPRPPCTIFFAESRTSRLSLAPHTWLILLNSCESYLRNRLASS